MLKKFKLVFLLVCLFIITSLQIGWCQELIKPKKIAVLPFSEVGAYYSIGSLATDFLTSDLVKMKSCQVVERAQLDQVLKEQAFNATGIVDSGTAVKLGGILGLDYLLMGNVSIDTRTKVGYYDSQGKWVKPSYLTTVKVITKIVDVKNGEIVWSDQRLIEDCKDERSNIDVNGPLEEAVYDMARRIYESYLPLKAYVVKVEGDRFSIDLGEDQNIKKGDTFLVMGVTESYTHPVTGEVITETKIVGKLKVVEVGSKLCVAEFVKDDKYGDNSSLIKLGAIVSKQIRSKPKGFLGLGWSGKHEF